MDLLLHAANVLYLFSYSVKDIFILRLLTVVAASLLLPYFLFRPEPLYAAIAWNVLFTIINLYRIVLLYRERRPVYFTEREQALYDAAFSSLTRHEFAKLLRAAEWKEGVTSECLFEKGSVMEEFIALASGLVAIKTNGEILDRRKAGDFVGETSLLTDEPIRARVEVSEPANYTSWSRDKLKKLLAEDPSLHASLQKIISHSLIRKLQAV